MRTTREPNSTLTQTLPLPKLMADGPPGTGIVARTTRVVASTRETVPSSEFATQTEPSP